MEPLRNKRRAWERDCCMFQIWDGPVHFKIGSPFILRITSTHKPQKQIPAGDIFLYVSNATQKMKNCPIMLCKEHSFYYSVLGSEREDLTPSIGGKNNLDRGLKWRIPIGATHTYTSQIRFQCATGDIYKRRSDKWMMNFVPDEKISTEKVLCSFDSFRVRRIVGRQKAATNKNPNLASSAVRQFCPITAKFKKFEEQKP